jgi:chorismate mutase-like protein
MTDLPALRARIDELDAALIGIIAERLEVCRRVAAVKETNASPVIQPDRVRDVVATRRQEAIDAGMDADFAEQLFRVLLAETHRIEVAGRRADTAPDKAGAATAASALDTVATASTTW